jgi:GNAT superfamily N-acetyltransferase
MIIRPGDEGDVPTVLALLDGAARWLVEIGRPGQWGTEPQATSPRRIAQAGAWAASGGRYLAEIDDAAVGALAVGRAPAHVPPAPEPELYVNFLVTAREAAGRGVGARLLRHAEQLARRQGRTLLRVDCYGGDDRALVRYYERQGFVATGAFEVHLPDRRWPGQVLQRRLG